MRATGSLTAAQPKTLALLTDGSLVIKEKLESLFLAVKTTAQANYVLALQALLLLITGEPTTRHDLFNVRSILSKGIDLPDEVYTQVKHKVWQTSFLDKCCSLGLLSKIKENSTEFYVGVAKEYIAKITFDVIDHGGEGDEVVALIWPDRYPHVISDIDKVLNPGKVSLEKVEEEVEEEPSKGDPQLSELLSSMNSIATTLTTFTDHLAAIHAKIDGVAASDSKMVAAVSALAQGVDKIVDDIKKNHSTTATAMELSNTAASVSHHLATSATAVKDAALTVARLASARDLITSLKAVIEARAESIDHLLAHASKDEALMKKAEELVKGLEIHERS
jgi:hypothetical protein